MATILEELHAYLLTQTGLTALVGQRIYPNACPQDCDMPCICYQVVSDTAIHTMGSDADNPRRPLVSYHAFAETYATCKTVAEQLRMVLVDLSGALATRTIQRIFWNNEYDIYEDDTGTHHIVVDFNIWYI